MQSVLPILMYTWRVNDIYLSEDAGKTLPMMHGGSKVSGVSASATAAARFA